MTKKVSNKQLREFALLIGFGIPIIIGWLIPKIFSHEIRIWTLWVGISLLIIGLIRPQTLKSFYSFWIELGNKLGFINSHIILGLVYILVLIPISFIMRSFGYDPLRTRKKNDYTYKEKRDDSRINLKRIF